MKPGTKLHILNIVSKVANVVVTLMGILCVIQAAYGIGAKSEFDRIMALIIGVWILTMATLEKRLKSIDQSLTMMAVTRAIIETVNNAHNKMKEMQKHGTETGNGAKAAKEAADHFDTTAKTGAHE